MRTSRLSVATLALALLAAPRAFSQAVPFDVELGYRWVDVTGNQDMYRSQVNDRSGFLVRSLNLSSTDFGGKTSSFLDSFRLDVSELGAGPAGALRLEAGKANAYRLRFAYRRTELFSALPGFANPLLSQGIIPGQHLSDRVRNTFDLELELLPWSFVTPIVGYSRNRLDGPGLTTYTVGGDEFRLASDLDDLDQEVHVGAAFHAGVVSGQVTQGWRKFHGEETLLLAPGGGRGNGTGTILGVDPSLATFKRTTDTTANTPITNAVVAAQVIPQVRVTGSYVRSKSSGDDAESEDLTGSLVSFSLSRFFKGLSESSSSRSELTFWRYSGRVEASVLPFLDLGVGYTRQHRELSGFDLVMTLFLDTTTFAGGDKKDIETLLAAETALERTEKIADASIVARPIEGLTIKVRGAQKDQDLTLTPDPSEIVVPGSQGGTFDRRVKIFDAGATYTHKALHLTLGADFRRERADRPVVRTDFVVRDRYRLRASWNHGELLRVGFTAMQVDTDNSWPAVGYEARLRQFGGEIEATPFKGLSVHFSGGKYEADSTVIIRRPQDFTLGTSVQAEDGRSLEGGVSVQLAPFRLHASLGRFDNEGTIPFRLDRARVSAEMDFTSQFGATVEWTKDEYKETSSSYANFDANRYGLYLRWHP